MKKIEEEELKKRHVITLDIENKRVLVEAPKSTFVLKELEKKNENDLSTGVYRNPTLIGKKAIFIPSKGTSRKKKSDKDWDFSRLQDDER